MSGNGMQPTGQGISIKGLSIELGEFHLRDIHLQVEAGEYMVVLGPTGAGKTVLLETVCGIETPRTGTVHLAGEDVTSWYPEERNIAYVPQDYALFPNLTVEENVGYGLTARGVEDGERTRLVQSMLAELSIDDLAKRLPLNLSGGERQRVALGRALITEPSVLLLDEPLSALDENFRAELAGELRRLQESRGATFVHVCHDFDEAVELADRIAIIDDGSLVQVGTIEEILAQPVSLFVARFTRARNFYQATAVIDDGKATMTVHLADGTELVTASPCHPGPVTVVVRPEHVTVPLDGATENVFVLKIAKVLHKLTHDELYCTGQLDLVIYRPRRQDVLSPGDEIALHIPPAKTIVFPRDD